MDKSKAVSDVRHFGYIDSLRGMAILGVIVVHLLDSLINSNRRAPYPRE